MSLADFGESGSGSDRSLREALRRLPMFPLPNVVLFPHALLPLHIFEERYKALARDVLAGHHFLAVTLLTSPDDADTLERPPVQRIAGVGEVVMAHELPDLPAADPSDMRDADQSLRALVGHLADAIPEGGELLRQVVVSQETPSELVDVIAAALDVDPTLRQRLLETRDVMKRIERVSAEVVAMASRIGTSPTQIN
jgi:Lon protease-like protein